MGEGQMHLTEMAMTNQQGAAILRAPTLQQRQVLHCDGYVSAFLLGPQLFSPLQHEQRPTGRCHARLVPENDCPGGWMHAWLPLSKQGGGSLSSEPAPMSTL